MEMLFIDREYTIWDTLIDKLIGNQHIKIHMYK